MAVSQEFIRQVSEALQSLSNSLENSDGYPRGAELIINKADMDNTIAVPGVKYNSNPAVNENAVAQAYVQIPWSILSQVLGDMETATAAATAAAGSVDEAIQGANDAADNADAKALIANSAATNANTKAGLADTAATNANTKAGLADTAATNANTKAGLADTAATNANEKAALANEKAGYATEQGDYAKEQGDRVDAAITSCNTATTEAENVNAQLSGMTVTITNRNGQAESVNIGFEIYATYASVAAMNADAVRVPEGKFVMIATTDPTSADNATLWSRNSSPAGSTTPFSFLSDLDQASSAAWADWLNNMKPTIEAKITQAETDHGIAVSDHNTASADHTTATSDHTQAGTDHTQADIDHSTAVSDHTQAGADHTRAETDHTTADSDHTTAGTDHSTAESDHSTASSDHNIATSDHSTADSDHGIAESDHTTAGSDHDIAAADHTQAEADHTASVTATNNANTQAGYAENIADHPPYIADGTAQYPGDIGYVYQWDYEHQIYVKGIQLSIDWETMSQAEKDALAQAVLDSIAFDEVPTEDSGNAVTSGGLYTIITAIDNRLQEAEKVASLETCEDIVDEIV